MCDCVRLLNPLELELHTVVNLGPLEPSLQPQGYTFYST